MKQILRKAKAEVVTFTKFSSVRMSGDVKGYKKKSITYNVECKFYSPSPYKKMLFYMAMSNSHTTK